MKAVCLRGAFQSADADASRQCTFSLGLIDCFGLIFKNEF